MENRYLSKKRQEGFTLLEVMVAVSILAVALTALFSLLSQSVRVANENKFATLAAILAQSKMAEIEALGTEEIGAYSGDFEEEYEGFSWSVEVEDVAVGEADNTGEYLKKIDLTISWGENRPLVYHLMTYLYQPV